METQCGLVEEHGWALAFMFQVLLPPLLLAECCVSFDVKAPLVLGSLILEFGDDTKSLMK